MPRELVPSSVRGSRRGATLPYLNVVSVFMLYLNTRISEFIATGEHPAVNGQVPLRSVHSAQDGNACLGIRAEFTRCYFFSP